MMIRRRPELLRSVARQAQKQRHQQQRTFSASAASASSHRSSRLYRRNAVRDFTTYSNWMVSRISSVSYYSRSFIGRHGVVGGCQLRNKSRRRLFSSSTTKEQATIAAAHEAVKRPSWKVLRWVAITTGIPFVGFGFLDNAILILAGDAIDTSLGVTLGISTMCAAAIGNIISDLAGLGLGTWIEEFCVTTLKMEVPALSAAQRQLRSVRLASQGGTAIGMTIGCIIGMFPLLFMDMNKHEQLRKRAELEALFKDVVTDAKTLVGAESACLFLRVDEVKNNDDAMDKDGKTYQNQSPWYRRWFSPSWWWSSTSNSSIAILPYRPSVDGELLYSMYYPIVKPFVDDDDDDHAGQRRQHQLHLPLMERRKTQHHSDGDVVTVVAGGENGHDQIETRTRLVPVGRGIVSRAVLTGDTWNITNVNSEPDFSPPPLVEDVKAVTKSSDAAGTCSSVTSSSSSPPRKRPRPEYRNMVVVPILDSRGRAIAAIEARNKIGDKMTTGPATSSSRRDQSIPSSPNIVSSFTDQDVEILKSLASHISVKLQLTYQVAEEGEQARGSLKDTISIMKELGIRGDDADVPLSDEHRRFFSKPYRRRGTTTRWVDRPSLFPSNNSSEKESHHSSPSSSQPSTVVGGRSPPSKSKSKLFPE
mmetsp:Transcript_40251/g.97232  ORF Transcript_40251/g.97232 Transcript_40251/m.97232 type:complete len:646 (-) Transcript_40251:343-2280(-)